MNEQFDLITPRPAKALLIVLLGTVAMLAAGAGVGYLLASYSSGLALGGALLTFAAGGYGIYRLLRGHASSPLTATVRPDALHLLWPRTELDKTIKFSQIESWRAENYKGNEELRLRLDDTTKLRIVVNPDLYGGPHLAGLVHCFEERLRAYPRPAGARAPLREKASLAGTGALVAVVLLVLLALALPVLALVLGKPLPGSAFFIFAGVVAYAVAVYRARQEQRQR